MSDEQKIQDENLESQDMQDSLDVEDNMDEEDSEGTVDPALEQTQQELADAKEQLLRVQAEMQNVRRRAEADVEKAHKFGLEKFAAEMLGVADNLERALAAAGDDEASKAIRDGVEMTLAGLMSVLSKFKVEAVDPLGESFNPEVHQAMSMVDSPDAEPNTVIAVMQKGYTLQGRLLRPAMVMVSKGAAQIDEQA